MASLELFGITDTLKPEFQKYSKVFKQIGENFETSYAIFHDKDYISKTGWKLDSHASEATVHMKHYPFGNLFVLTGTVPAPIDQVFQVLIKDFEKTAEWHPNLVFSKVFAEISENAAVIHYANPDFMLVKSRDFVAGRIWRKIGDEIYIAARSVEVDEIKELKNHVRGRLQLGCGRMTPINDETTKVEYLLSIDFRGFLPKSVVNTVLGKLMIKDFDETVKHFKQIRKN